MEEIEYLKNGELILDDETISYLAKKIGCEEEHIWKAVSSVGLSIFSIKAYLEMNRLIKH